MPTPAEVEAARKGWPDTISAWKVLCEAHTEAEAKADKQAATIVDMCNEHRVNQSALRESEAKLADVMDYARHTHEARYAVSGEKAGKLMDACDKCGLDLRHDIHSALQGESR